MRFSRGVGLTCALLGFAATCAAQTGTCGALPFDAACATVFTACTKSLKDTNNPFATGACAAAATCHNGRIDAFLTDLSCRISDPNNFNQTAAGLPRLSDSVYNGIANGGPVSYDAYSKWITGLARAADPGVEKLIDYASIKTNFDSILAWTGFCSNGNIPKKNFLDWFQFSATVGGPVASCGLISNCPLQFSNPYPYAMDLLVACANDQNSIKNPFSNDKCVAAALNNPDGIDSFLQALTCRYNLKFGTNLGVPASTSLPPLSVGIAGGSPVSQQKFIDFTYTTLSSVGASVRWPAVDWVINRWSLITKWTGFCSAAVPQKNLSDLLLYSHFRLGLMCPANNGCTVDPNPSCAQLFQSCVKSLSIINVWSTTDCVLAATCYNGGVKSFATAVSCAKGTSGKDALPVNWPRLSSNVWSKLANPSTGLVGFDDYVTAIDNSISSLSSPSPACDYLSNTWAIIEIWTGFRASDVPFGNFADWLQYS